MYIHRHNNKSALLVEYTCFQVLQDGGGSVVYIALHCSFFKCMVLMMVTLSHYRGSSVGWAQI